MKRFILFKASKDIFPLIGDVIKMLVGNRITVSEIDDLLLIIYSDFNVLEVKNTIQSLETDLNMQITCYCSYLSEDIDLELKLVLPLLKEKTFGFYDFKSLIGSFKGLKSSEILHFIIDGTGVDENVIEKMAIANLNVSKAANMLYLHRNSLNYKIERLIQLRDFDLRCFIDCYILYSLL